MNDDEAMDEDDRQYSLNQILKLADDGLRDKVSPLFLKAHLEDLLISYKLGMYKLLAKLGSEQRAFRVQEHKLQFQALRNKIYPSKKQIDKHLKKYDVTIDRISGYGNDLGRIIGLDRLDEGEEFRHWYSKCDIEGIRSDFYQYFLAEGLDNLIEFVNSLERPYQSSGDTLEAEQLDSNDMIRVNLTSEELAIFFRILKESKLISKDISAMKLALLVSNSFVSKDSDQNTPNSIATKYYSKDSVKIRRVTSYLSVMEKIAQKLIDKSDK